MILLENGEFESEDEEEDKEDLGPIYDEGKNLSITHIMGHSLLLGSHLTMLLVPSSMRRTISWTVN